MGLIKEPKNVDFSVESKPWTAEELLDFRKQIAKLKEKNTARKLRQSTGRKKKILA
jgi:hypothetical protein